MRNATMFAMLLPAALLCSACGVEGPECGPGTRAEGDTCVPEISECAPGTTLNAAGQCEPACGDDQYWDGAACVDAAACAPGTVADDSGQCVPACGEEQYWDGSGCVDVPGCASGTTFNEQTGQCEPDETACGEGTHWDDGACVPDVTCGPNTHADENGQCVPDDLPDPDVTETGDPDTAAPFDLPVDGAAVHLGGTVDTPADLNGDGFDDADWDTFIFTAEAGAYLRVTASSAGATLPGFLVMSVASNDEGAALYARWALNPNGPSTTRELYLPFAGEYVIQFSDYNHVLSRAFGYGYIPVGGDEFTYVATVENLGDPQVEDIDALPHQASGVLTDNSLRFFSLKALDVDEAVELLSPGEPVEGAHSDVYGALSVFDPDHAPVREVTTGRMTDDALLRFAAVQAGDHLVVQDFLLTLGPVLDFSLVATVLQGLDCTGAGDCTGGALVEGETPLLFWDLAAGDFLALGVYLPEEAPESIRATLHERNLGALTAPQYASQYGNAKFAYYAETATRLYLRLWEDKGEPVASFSVDARVIATDALASGQSYADLSVYEMPDDTEPDAGLCHYAGVAGELVLFTDLATKAGTWVAPIEQVLTPALGEIGPAYDVLAEDFPAARITPPMALLQSDGHALYRVSDPDEAADIAGGAYDLGFLALTPEDLGSTGAAIARADQALDGGYCAYAFVGTAGEMVEIAATPDAALRPEVMLLVPGARLYQDSRSTWAPDAASPTLGLLAHHAAAADGEAARALHRVSYEGLNIVLVSNIGAAGGGETFALSITALAPPANDTCAAAEAVDLSSGTAQVLASMDGATDSLDLGFHNACTNDFTSGPDRFYALELAAGDALTVTITADFDAVTYLLDDCAAAPACAAASTDGVEPTVLEFTVPDGGDGTYLLGVDGSGPLDWGDFTLDIVRVAQ